MKRANHGISTTAHSPSNTLIYHSEFRTPNLRSIIPHCDSLRSLAWLPPANRTSPRLVLRLPTVACIGNSNKKQVFENYDILGCAHIRTPNSALRIPNSEFRTCVSTTHNAVINSCRRRLEQVRQGATEMAGAGYLSIVKVAIE